MAVIAERHALKPLTDQRYGFVHPTTKLGLSGARRVGDNPVRSFRWSRVSRTNRDSENRPLRSLSIRFGEAMEPERFGRKVRFLVAAMVP